MALSEQQEQDLIILEVGDDAAGTLATVVPLSWERYAALELPARTRATKLAAIDAMLGRVRGQVKIVGVGGASVDAHQLTTHLQDMRALVQSQIDAASSAGASGGAVGDLTTTSPIAPPTGAPDASGRVYRGDPYLTRRRP